MFEYIPDNYDRWEQHQHEQDQRFERLPECEYCGEKIQDDHFYEINDEILCERCLNEHCRKDTADYVG